jgi:hypothetical protein
MGADVHRVRCEAGIVVCAGDDPGRQTELQDRQHWDSRAELAQAIFEYIEAFDNLLRHLSSLEMLSPTTCDRIKPLRSG